MKKLIDKTLECQKDFESFFGNKNKFDYSEDFQCNIQDKYFRTGKSLMIYSKKNKTLTISFPELNVTTHFIVYFQSILKYFSFSENVKELDFLICNKLYIKCNDNMFVKINSYIKDIDVNFQFFNYFTDGEWKVHCFNSPDIIYELISDTTYNLKISTKHSYIDIIDNEVKCLRLDRKLVFMIFSFNLYVNISFKDIFIVDNDNPKLKEDFTKLCFFLNLNRDTVLSEGIIKNLRFLAELSKIIPDDLKVKIRDTDYTVYPEYVEYKAEKEKIGKLYEISKLFIENSVYSDFKICSFDGLEVDFINKDVFIKINSNSDDEISKEIDKYCNEILNVADFIKIGYKNSFKIYNRN